MKLIDRAHATDIMIDHSGFFKDSDDLRVCNGATCHWVHGSHEPTKLDIITHQLRKLEEAGFGFLREGAK